MKKEAAPAKAEKAAPPPAAEKKEEAPKKPQHTGEQTELSRLEMRTGKILEISKHPEADKLYVEKIDLGEASGPRTIVSGLVEYLREDELLGKEVIVLANLKPSDGGYRAQACSCAPRTPTTPTRWCPWRPARAGGRAGHLRGPRRRAHGRGQPRLQGLRQGGP
ncbi:unnamed protein product [Heterosigma akashiwo]